MIKKGLKKHDKGNEWIMELKKNIGNYIFTAIYIGDLVKSHPSQHFYTPV